MVGIGTRGTGRLAALLLAGALAGCGGGAATAAPTTAPVATPAGQASAAAGGAGGAISCAILGPADFAAAGISGAASPSDNPDGSGGHYCVYAGTSGATGGIELDLFPSPDVATAKDTYTTAAGEGPSGAPAAGASFSDSTFAVDGGAALLTVRQGRLVLSLGVPDAPTAQASLVTLARLVIERAGDAASG